MENTQNSKKISQRIYSKYRQILKKWKDKYYSKWHRTQACSFNSWKSLKSQGNNLSFQQKKNQNWAEKLENSTKPQKFCPNLFGWVAANRSKLEACHRYDGRGLNWMGEIIGDNNSVTFVTCVTTFREFPAVWKCPIKI